MSDVPWMSFWNKLQIGDITNKLQISCEFVNLLHSWQISYEWHLHSNDKKNKFSGCFTLILLVDMEVFPTISSEPEKDLEGEFSFAL